MSAAGETNSSPVPGTVFTPRQVRILKVAVIAMGILLVGGFAFVLAAIVYQASRPAQVAAGRSATDSLTQSGLNIDLPVPRDASVGALSLDGNRLAVQLNGSAGAEIAIIDLASGKIVARVRLEPQ
jgi:hypothetical protein